MSHNQSAVSEKAGIKRLTREMGFAMGMALIAIVYVVQAFRIPTPSMEESLIVGDQLLSLKFFYGAPLLPYAQELGITTRFPAVRDPKPGDIVIFKYPGIERKQYVKRNIAGPGSVVEIRGTKFLVDGEEVELPPGGNFSRNGRLDERITNFEPLRIPQKGDILKPQEMPIREFLFLKHLIKQENSRKNPIIEFDLYIDGNNANDLRFNYFNKSVSLSDLNNGKVALFSTTSEEPQPFDFNMVDDWTKLDAVISFVLASVHELYPESEIEVRHRLYLDGEPLESYEVRFDNYFMIGDNRDNSLDSRYWGYVNRNYIKAKALIVYFSLDTRSFPWVRWDRVGRLIR